MSLEPSYREVWHTTERMPTADYRQGQPSRMKFTKHRIDYVLLGGKAVVHQARSELDATFDNGSPQEDHKLLQLAVWGVLDATDHTHRLLRKKYDCDKLMSEEGRARFRKVLAAFPHPDWATDVDQHCHAIETYLQRELDTHTLHCRALTKRPPTSQTQYGNFESANCVSSSETGIEQSYGTTCSAVLSISGASSSAMVCALCSISIACSMNWLRQRYDLSLLGSNERS